MEDDEPEFGNELAPLYVKPARGPGRPALKDVRALAQEHTTRAIDTLVSIMANEDMFGSVRVAAAQVLLAYGHGKPMQMADVTIKRDSADNPLKGASNEQLEQVYKILSAGAS